MAFEQTLDLLEKARGVRRMWPSPSRRSRESQFLLERIQPIRRHHTCCTQMVVRPQNLARLFCHACLRRYSGFRMHPEQDGIHPGEAIIMFPAFTIVSGGTSARHAGWPLVSPR